MSTPEALTELHFNGVSPVTTPVLQINDDFLTFKALVLNNQSLKFIGRLSMEMIEATVTVPLCLKIGMLDRIEKERGNQSRSSYVRDIISTYFLAADDTEEEENDTLQ